MKRKGLFLSVAIPLVVVLSLLWLLDGSPPAQAAPLAHPQQLPPLQTTSPITRYVSITGSDSGNDCTHPNNPCATIQHAVDVASSGDLILISGGVFTDSLGLIPSVVSISDKSLTLRGGYTTTFGARDPEAWPTIVDGENVRRGFFISSSGLTAVAVTIEGVRVRNGYGNSTGGGIYVQEAALILTDTHVYSSVAGRDTSGYGGGVYAITATLYISGSTFHGNTACMGSQCSHPVYGGGLYARNSTLEVRNSIFRENVANVNGFMGYGGGLFLDDCIDCRVANNIIQYNWAGRGGETRGKGGGIFVARGNRIVIRENEIAENVGGQYSSGDFLSQSYGGGMNAYYPGGQGLLIEENQFLNNTATLRSAENRVGVGGGLCIWGTTLNPISITVRSNLFQGNVANQSGRGLGGAMFFWLVHTLQVEANTLLSNSATVSDTPSSWMGGGGGLLIMSGKVITLDNNIIAANRVGGEGWGDGIYLSEVSDAWFRHNTLADNGPNGVYLTATQRITFINTIVATHTVGITASSTAQALLDYTLWYGNDQNTGGPGVITDTNGMAGFPGFVDPARWNYHIGPNSWAINRGTDAGVANDIDGDPRPLNGGFDIGADEVRLFYLYLPLVMRNYP